MTAEIWKAVPNYPSYGASSYGAVRRVGRQKPLRPFRSNSGYLICSLSEGGAVAKLSVVNLTYVTRQENVDHAQANGRYRGASEHWTQVAPEKIARGDMHGSHLKPDSVLRGSRNGRSKITESDVRSMRAMRASGSALKAISGRFGVGVSQVSNIISGKQWRHA
jgi:hypothetical protein